MKTEITLQIYTLENLIDTYDDISKQMKTPAVREYFTGKRSALEDLLILFRDPSDES